MNKKRWVIKLALSLLAGAVVTWGVAWGCALWGPEDKGHRSIAFDACTIAWERPPAERHADANALGNITVWRTLVGLPLRSMQLTERWRNGMPTTDGVPIHADTMGWLRPAYNVGELPLRILPLSFALNTLLAAAVILTLTEGAGAYRRRARRRKGRCPWCGYDRAGVAVEAACPECGEGLVKRAFEFVTRRAAVLLSLALLYLLIDAALLPTTSIASLRPDRRFGTFHPAGYFFVQSAGTWKLVDDPKDASGRVWAFVRLDRDRSIWAPTRGTYSVRIYADNFDGSPALVEQIQVLGGALGDLQGGPGSGAWTLLRAGGGTSSVALPFGYLRNTIAIVVALIGLASGVGCVRRIQERSWRRRGCCNRCGYDRSGLGPNAACPECGGRTPPAPLGR